MKQLRDKYDIEDDSLETEELKHLPDAFNDKKDELSLGKSIVISTLLHPLSVGLVWLIITLLTLWGIFPDLFNKPAMKPKDIEFVLTTKEEMPINKNTPIRSDKNSRAGGEHDPTRKVSQPSPAPAPKVAPSPAPQKQKAKQPQKQPTPPKPQKQQVQPQPQPQKQQPAKPTPSVAPKPSVAPPTARPSTSSPRPAMPKLSTNPKSPFSIEVPKSTGPVGPAPSSGTDKSSGSSGGSSSGGGSSGSGMPSPQFSASKGGSSGGSGSKGSQGSYGSGNLGNPSAGNRSGAPGIDALKQPNWGAYMAEVERRVKRNWTPPKGEESKRVVVLFRIGRDGRLLSIRVSKSSGQPLADQAAKAAIELSAPFRPLPPEYKDSSIDIDFTFDYNVVGAKYR